MNTTTFKNPLLLILVFLFIGYFGNSQVTNNFDVRYSADIRGELTFIANNIVNRQVDAQWQGAWERRGGRWIWNPQAIWIPAASPNDPYNLTGNASQYNDFLNMQYIDVDTDATTFSSSSATLDIPDEGCALIRYAGLYWGATYVNSDRSNIDDIKFKTPNGTYQDITADEILYDGDGDPTFGGYSPYACYKDVTSIITALPNPDGEYTVANVLASNGGGIPGGISGGWSLVLVYENPNLPGSKYITTFDGYAGIASAAPDVDIPVNGFTTLPAPFNVKANIGIGALEGDNRITGDGLEINANGSFTPLSSTVNPANNFFNSNISIDPNIFTNRNPNSTNTLGWDVDLFPVTNVPNNNVIPNDATSATLRLSTTGDKFDVFFVSFDVEIIQPNIVLEKRVNTPGGVDITGQGVHLGQILDYVLTFQNIGNDDANNYTIRDVLPINVAPPNGVNFTAADMVLPPGVTYTYTPATRTVVFSIPNDLVEQGLTPYSIRMRVQVAENCFDFIDACSDLIENLAYSSYSGIENSAVITDDPSVTDFDACGFVVPGATNFLLDDLSDCNFDRTIELCGNEAVLDAGDNFDDYIWYRDANGNNQLDIGIDVLLPSDGDADNDQSTYVVTQVGTYIVDKIVADPCKGFKEIITVVPYGTGVIANPIIEYFNEVNADTDPFNDLAGEIVQCSVDNDMLPKLFLCGVGDTRLLQINILDAQSLVWEKLDEGSCSPSGDDCANKNLSCTWSPEGTGNNYLVNDAGQYRLLVTYQNGCISRFYFNVFQNTLDILYNSKDIVCNTNGNITITNLGAGYGYQLVDDATGGIVTPFSANNGPSFDFNSGENGAYRVQVTQLDNTGAPIIDACIFETPVIGILDRDVQYNVDITPANCTVLGTATIQVTNADANYNYEIRLDDGSNSGLGTLVDDELAQTNNNFTFTGLNAGNYIATVTTDDGCSYSEQITIIDENDLDLTAQIVQHITCEDAIIQMSSSGGEEPHAYAIWEYSNTSGTTITSYPSINDIPPSEFQTNINFNVTQPGSYSFVVVDNNSCYVVSNTVTIELRPAAQFNPTSITNVVCFGESTGTIALNLLNANNNTITYFLFDAVGFDEQDYELANALDTSASGLFNGLAAGDYVVVTNQVNGSASCDYFEYNSITAPTNALTGISALINDYTCTQDGIIEAQNVTGGTAPYSYSIDGITFIPDTTPNAHRFENLTNGTYTITIRDANGCTIPTDPITLNPLNEPSDLTFTASTPVCPAQTANVTVSVVDGNTPFVFDIIAPSAIGATSTTGGTATFENLAPDTYTFRVTDNKGCSYTENFTISPITPINVVGALVNNVRCVGNANGAIDFTLSGFSTTYSYTVNGATAITGQSASTINLTGLAAGNYTIVVTDETTNCTDTDTIIVNEPTTALVIDTITPTDPSCTGAGSVSITVSGGWPGYTYEIIGPSSTSTTNNTGNFTGLSDTSAAYTVNITDVNGCVVSGNFTLNPTVTPVLEVSANSLCYDSATGLVLSANVTSGGVAPFQYRINSGAYQNDTDFTGLAPGNYTVEVIDSKNCTATASISVFPTLTASASLVKDVDCSVTPDAEISISIAGGNPTFTYEVIRDGSSVQASTAVPSIPFSYFTTTAGTYQFVITDNESCTITTNTVVVTDNNPPTVTELTTNPLCNTSADGTVELQISGGTAPYQIVFNGSAPSTQTTYAGLADGTYNYTITDAKGCITNDSVTITAPTAVVPGTITIVQDYRCDNTSATLQVIGYSGGTPGTGYTFSLDGVNFQSSDTFNSGITAGSYTITVKDANDCITSTPAVVIDPLDAPTDLTFAATAPTCPAITSNVTISVTEGNAPFTYEIIAPVADATNNGTNNIFTSLAPSTYTFRVTDAKGCQIDENYTVSTIEQVGVIAQLTNHVTCYGQTNGAFNFTVSDFTGTYSYTVENSASTVIQTLNNSSVTTAIAITGLAADTYTVTITDDTTNCTATTNMLINDPPAALDFSFTNTAVTCILNGSINVTAIDGWGSYEYQLENTVGPAIVFPYQNSNVFTNVPAGSYTIYVRDGSGCIVDKPINLDSADAPIIAVDPTSDYCYDNTDQSSLIITITDGIAPFTYSINGGAQNAVIGNPFTIANITPGAYNIQVTDAYGCVSNILSETIEPQLTATAIVTKDLDCTVSPDATIAVSISNGYLPYATYEVSTDAGASWSATTAIAGNSFVYTTATAGTYDFRITDANDCTFVTQAVINPLSLPDISSLVQTVDILCNGDAGATIDITIDNTLGTAPYTIAVVNTTTATNYGTQTSGLPAGNYEVTVTDAKSCSDMETIVIAEPTIITYDINLIPITCVLTGTAPGSITVENTTGGTPEYSYHLTGNNGFSASYSTTSGGEDYTFAILEFGIYEVDVIDANGCSVVTTNIIASPPDDLDIDVSALTTDCSLGGSAEVTVATTILGTDYEFGILDSFALPYASTFFAPDVPNGPTHTFTGLTPGITYTFVVRDNTTGCYYFESASSPITTLSTLTSTLDAVANITCTGSSDGNVSFTFDNYDPTTTSVEYEIFHSQSNLTTGITGSSPVNPPAVGTGISVSNLGPLSRGVYYLQFTELGGVNAGCTSASNEFTITESTNLLTVDATAVTNDNCNVNAGQISAVGQYGTAPYEYQLALATDIAPTATTWAGSTANNFNVEGGNYIVYIKDANNCIQQDAITVITDPTPAISVAINNQCTAIEGAYSVDITLDAIGVVPHTISIDGGTPQATTLNVVGAIMTVSNLSSGSHSFTISDVNGCTETENITIYPPLNLGATISAADNCDPANSGEITVTASGGSGSYSYTQITPTGSTNATGIFSGLTHSVSYTFEVEDTTTNCTRPVSITLPAPLDPSFTLAATAESCNTANDGTITVSLNPGNIDVAYAYSLDGGTTTQPTNVFSGLDGGTYNVTVISAKGCDHTESIDVIEPTQLEISASASAFSCNLDASTITVTIDETSPGVPSGTSPYTYSFDGGTNYQTNNTFDVPFGSPNVNVVVKDANGCTANVLVSIPVTQEVTASIVQNQIIDCDNGEEIIEINALNGSGTYTYVSLPSGTIVADPTNIILTTPGTYIYEITDTVTNCTVTVQHQIAPYNLINVTADLVSNASCSDSSDGVISATISGYTGTFDYEVLDFDGNAIGGTSNSDNATSDPYTFNIATTLAAGTYSVRITETATPECIATTNTVTIDAPEPLSLSMISNVNATCVATNAIVTVQADGGSPAYNYGAAISGAGDPGVYPFDNTIELDPTTSLNWDIYVEDSNGCVIAVPLAISVNTDTTPDISLAIDDVCANEGSFGITVSLDAIQTGVAPYSMRINGSAYQSVASFPYTYTGLPSGAYTIEIRDANGCTEIENISIDAELTANAIALTQPTCTTNDGVIEFTVNGGSGTYTAALLQSDLTPTGISPTGNQFTGVGFGDYIVRITDNTLGAPNCTANASISLEEPTPVTLNTTLKTDITCNGYNNGTITVSLVTPAVGVNDNPPYTYTINNTIDPAISNNTGIFTGLNLGIYSITVTSNRGCIGTDSIEILEPTLLAVSASATEFACAVDNTVNVSTLTIDVPVTGTAPYTYSIDGTNFFATNTFTIADTGITQNITATVKDTNGCTDTDLVILEPLNSFTVAVTTDTNISCTGPEEVTITVTDNGIPTNSYTYELLPLGNPDGSLTATPSNVTATFDLTAVGNYVFRITDTNTGCYVDTVSYDIAPYDLIEVTATAVDPVICFNDGNGSIEINISGYTGTYDYQVFDSLDNPVGVLVSTDTTVNPKVIPGLNGGNYYVQITETAAPSCAYKTNVVTILSPDSALTEVTRALNSVTCTNDQGEISIEPLGGIAPYDITVTNNTTAEVLDTAFDVNSVLLTSLAAGDYSVTIVDANGCSITNNYPNLLVMPITVTANAIPLNTMVSCFGDKTVTVTATNVLNGSGNYTYLLNYYDATGTNITFTSGPQNSPDFADLGEGIYSITVSDGWDCDVETNTVTITEPTLIEATLIRTDPLTCATGVAFELSATGGSGSYEYSLDNITFNPMTSNPMSLPETGVLGAGMHQYYVRDLGGVCTSVASNAITENPIENLILYIEPETITSVNCNGENTAIIYASASGGLGNYQYELYTDSSLTVVSRLFGPQSNGEFANLTAGTYYVNVISEDCTAPAQEIIITEPSPLTYEDTVVNVSCSGEEDASITVTLSGGSGGYLYSISPNLNQFDTINTFQDLTEGDYTIIAQDANGCFEYLEYTITTPLPLTLAENTVTPVTCLDALDGSITVDILNGTPPYRTALNSNVEEDFIANRVTFNNLASENYLILVRDANDCETNIQIEVDSGVNLNATVVPVYECTSDVPTNYVNITLEDSSVLGDILYAIDSTDPADMQLNPDFRNSSPGMHYIAISHNNGCIQTFDFEIEDYAPLTLTLEQHNLNEITAIAGGGKEDYTFVFEDKNNGTDNTFRITETGIYTVTVIDANGCQISTDIYMEFIDIEIPKFFTPNGDNENDTWAPKNQEAFPEILTIIFDRYGREVYRITLNSNEWDGLYKQKELPTGDYWYVIKLKGEEDDREFVGNFTLFR